jgi:hypothetical protein
MDAPMEKPSVSMKKVADLGTLVTGTNGVMAQSRGMRGQPML